jgi:hypothetical protein
MGKLVTTNYKLHIASQLVESVSEVANTAYYLYVGNHVPYANSTIPVATDNEKTVFIDSYRNMIMGKRVGVNDISLMIRNIPYVSNTVYEMYDDATNNLSEKDFFVIVNEGSYFHVYKCLDNNNGAKSVVEPEYSHISGSNTFLYQTSDGYRWKYMYSVSSSVNQKFASNDYFPVMANTVVEDQAVSGAIDTIKVEDGGRGYDNYTSGIFAESEIKYLGISNLYEISNTNASNINGFYEGCIIYITNGPGAGSYRRIGSYSLQSGKKIIALTQEFDANNAPSSGSEYQIFPEVKIYGDGLQTSNAIARALVNATSGNSVYRVEILNRGENYRYSSANVAANSVVFVDRPAVVRPIYSPYGGHGKNPAKELYASEVCVSVKFSNNESNTILSTNQFQQIGILKDPLFANVKIEYDTLVGNYITDEKVFKITPYELATNASVTTVSDLIECAETNFANQVSAGDYVYIKSSDDSNHQISIVREVVNSSHIKISSNAYFSCSQVIVHNANVSSFAYVSNVEASSVSITDLSGILSTNDVLVGVSSGAWMNVSSISRNNKNKSFNTFIQLNKYDVTVNALSFAENELVYKGNNFATSTASAYLHSVINTGGSTAEIYVSNQVGDFTLGDSMRGFTSGAVAVINNRYSPEIVFGSGDILYLENVNAVERNENESENFKVIFEF